MERAERKLINCADVIVQPHRRMLDASRVAAIRSTMRQHGLLDDTLGAAVVYRPSVGYVLVAGEHRWAAASVPGGKVRVIVLKSWAEFAAWMAIDQLDTRRTPMDAITAVHFMRKAIVCLRPGRTDKPGLDISEYTGNHRQVLDNVRWSLERLDDPDEEPRVKELLNRELTAVRKGTVTGFQIRDVIRRARDRWEKEAQPAHSAATWRKSLESNVPQMAGTLDALLAMGVPPDDLPAADLEKWANVLGQLSWKITSIKKNLRRSAQ